MFKKRSIVFLINSFFASILLFSISLIVLPKIELEAAPPNGCVMLWSGSAATSTGSVSYSQAATSVYLYYTQTTGWNINNGIYLQSPFLNAGYIVTSPAASLTLATKAVSIPANRPFYISHSVSEVTYREMGVCNAAWIDSTAPTTTGAITAGTLGTNSWYKSNVTFTLTPADAGSGVASTVYCIDTANTCNPASNYTSVLTISTESATNYIRWKSTDVAGNVQTVQSSGAIKIDKTAPTSNSISIKSGAPYTNSAINALTLASTGTVSGIYQMQFSCNNSNWTTLETYATSKASFNITNAATGCSVNEGTKTIYARFSDLAGNVSTAVNDTIFYDITAPVIPNILSTEDEISGDITGAFTADIPSGSTDTGGSGLASYSLWKCDDITLETNCVVIASGINGTTVSVSGEFLPVEDSTFYYYWTSIDNAGNTSNKSTGKALTMNAILPPPLTDTPTPTPLAGGTMIQNVGAGIEPVLITDWSTNLETTAQTGTTAVGVEDTVNSNIKVAEMDVNFNTAPDWSGVTGATDENIAFFHSTEPISTITNGAATSYTLYIRKGEGDKVLICPGATSLSEVNLTCAGGYYLVAGQTYNGATASVITNGVEYWKVTGLTSTGGMSVLTGLRDTLSRLQVSSPSDHKITFGSTYGLIVGSTDTMEISFPNFDLSTITLSDIDLTDSLGNSRTLAALPDADTWGVIIDSLNKTITFSVPTSGTGGYDAPSQVAIKIGTNAGGTNQIVNPSLVGNTTITMTLNNTAPGEMGLVNIPIVDSDRVDITGYVTAYIHFDIDTATGEVPGTDPVVDCNYNVCQTHENGDPGLNYTVDLGELTSAVVNKSNTTSVAHTSGGNGIINSIYFDITTNAPSGAVVTVKSANGGLQGPGTNKIPSIGITTGADGVVRSDGEDIPANSGVYGYNLPVASSQLHGSIIPNSLCDSVVKFCGPDTVTPKTVFTTNNLPVDTARVRMDLAAAANYTNNPGLYTDTLTFVATATF